MAKQKRILGQPIGFLLGQASGQPMHSGPMMANPTPFSNPGGGAPFLGGGSGALSPLPPSGGTGGIGGLLQGLFGGNGGSISLPSILSNVQKMIGAVNQAGEVFRNVGPMLQLFRGLDLGELLASDDNEEVLTEVDEEAQKKQKKRKKSKRRRSKSRKKKKSATKRKKIKSNS